MTAAVHNLAGSWQWNQARWKSLDNNGKAALKSNLINCICRDPRVSNAGAKLLAIHLVNTYVNHGNGMAWPRQKRLAKELGVSPSTIKRQIGELGRTGWLLNDHAGGKRDRSSNCYLFNYSRVPVGVRTQATNRSERPGAQGSGSTNAPTQGALVDPRLTREIDKTLKKRKDPNRSRDLGIDAEVREAALKMQEALNDPNPAVGEAALKAFVEDENASCPIEGTSPAATRAGDRKA